MREGVLRVFISSAGGALAGYRSAAVEMCQRLGHVPVHIEEFRPERASPLDACERRVKSSSETTAA